MSTSTMMQSLHIVPRSGNTRTLETQRNARDMRGSVARRALRPALVVRQLRDTQDVRVVARRMRVKANDIAMVLLECLDQKEAA